MGSISFHGFPKVVPVPAALVLVAVLSLGLVSSACDRVEIINGVVDHRLISGTRSETFMGILMSYVDDDGTVVNIVKDAALQHCIPADSEVVVAKEMETQLLMSYTEVFYQVSVRESPQHTVGYRTTREIFNRMRLGSTVRFEAREVSGVPRILRLLG